VLGQLRSALSALASQPVARRRAWVVLASVLVCAYAAGVLGYVLTTPEIGIRCAFAPVVNHFYPEFLDPPRQSPLRPGDQITKVADQPVENWSHFLQKLSLLSKEAPQRAIPVTEGDLRKGRMAPEVGYAKLGDRLLVRVVVERPGESKPRSVWCRLGGSPLETVVPSVLWFFLKVGLFVVGAIVFWKRPEDRPAARFFWLCIVSFGAYMGGYHWARIVTQPVLLVVFMGCAILLPAVALHFYLVFPRPKGFIQQQPRRALLAIYGLPVFFFLLLLSGYLRILWLEERGEAGGLGLFGPLPGEADDATGGVRLLLLEMLYEIYAYFAVAMLWYLASIACLVDSYRRAANPTERNQVKWILFGSLAALLPFGYTLYLAFWEQERFGKGDAVWPMLTASAFVTAAYTVSITRYRLMQLDQIVSSGMVYFLISFVAGVLYYAMVAFGILLVGSRVGEAPSLGQVLAVSSTALVLVLTLDVARGRLKRALDRHFRKEKHQLDRTLQRMSQAIDRLVDPLTLARRLLHTAADLLGASGGSVYLRQGDPALYGLADSQGPTPPLSELSSGCPLVEAVRIQPTVGVAARPLSPPAQRQLAFLGGAVAQGLLHEGQLLGLLVLGPRAAGPYSAEDVQLLAAFAQVTVLALVSAENHRLIERLNHDLKTKVEKIAEQQRRILALQSQLMRQRDRREDAPRTTPAGPPEPATTAAAAPVVTAQARPQPAPAPGPAEQLIGSGAQVHSLLNLVRLFAASPSAVLLRGESGTGKELLARAVHDYSPRAGKPFIKVHCAALSQGLLESELFGHVKGAFTSAIRDKVGRFESADGGTLFLDEIGDINIEVQTKLLRVLEEMKFERVGSSEPVQVDVRVIAATHQNLEDLIRQGRFREDLYFRLNVLPIQVPPLRERAEDIPELVEHFLRLYSHRTGKAVTAVDDDALTLLKGFSWPGNVRQLENVIERAVVIAEGPTITPAELPEEVRAAPAPQQTAEVNGERVNGQPEPPADLVGALQTGRAERERREREHLVRALAAAGGNKAEAARALGVPRSTLVSKLKKFGLS
jgi:transcriptional regulator with GAF, ATPase, and Fis domain